jgi:hypothetical protein
LAEDFMKYLCLAYEEQRKLDELSTSECQVLRNETLDYVDSLRKSGRLIITHARQSATTASTVRIRGGDRLVKRRPVCRDQGADWRLLPDRGARLSRGCRIAAKWPSARLGTIEVRPTPFPVPTNEMRLSPR